MISMKCLFHVKSFGGKYLFQVSQFFFNLLIYIGWEKHVYPSCYYYHCMASLPTKQRLEPDQVSFWIVHVIYLVQLGWFDESIYNLDLINFAFFFFVQNKMISSFLYFFFIKSRHLRHIFFKKNNRLRLIICELIRSNYNLGYKLGCDRLQNYSLLET